MVKFIAAPKVKVWPREVNGKILERARISLKMTGNLVATPACNVLSLSRTGYGLLFTAFKTHFGPWA